MKYIEYTHNPIMPIELEKLALSVIGSTEDLQEKYAGAKSSTFQIYKLPDTVSDWIKTQFPETLNLSPIDFRIHVLHNGIKIHKDYGRKLALNYVIDNGGQNACTKWYDENKITVLHEEKIKSRSWHKFNTAVFHGIDNIEKNIIRIGITVTLEKVDEINPISIQY